MQLQVPLDIPNVEILKVQQNKTDDIIVTVRSTSKFTHCHQCGEKISKVHGYGEPILLRHLSILDHCVYIRIKLTRYKCENCKDGPTTTEQPEWFNRRSKFTKAYEDYLMRMLINSTIFDVARKEHLTYDAVEGALKRQIATEVNWDAYTKIPQLGLDEIALKKGHKDFVVIVTMRIANKTKIIAILPDRKKETVKKFLDSIPERLKPTIEIVCSDMYDGYINAAKETLGQHVKIVIDRFHVAKSYGHCVDDLRKKELKRLKKELSDEEYKKLKGAMWALRKKGKNLTADETIVLNNLFKHSPDIKQAYTLRAKLTKIFDEDINKKEAEKKIKKWIAKVCSSGLKCFNKFISTLQNYWSEILNYFNRRGRKNSGFVEGLNNKIKTIKRRCYGILDIKSLFQRIYLDLEGYALYT